MNTRADRRSQADSDTSAILSDDALGIGADEDGPASEGMDMDALMSHPAFAAALEKAVSARLGAVAAPLASGASSEAAFTAFLSKFEHLVEVRDEQRPGYQKPLTANEIDARRQGFKDMKRLLREFKTNAQDLQARGQRLQSLDCWPHYLLADEGNRFYGPSPLGDILYEAGQEIRTFQAPSEGWSPINDAAMQVFSAYKAWVGDPVSIEELTAQAVIAVKGEDIPQFAPKNAIESPDVMVVDAPKRDVTPKRAMGVGTPERHGRAMPAQPGVMQQPVGPVFVGDV